MTFRTCFALLFFIFSTSAFSHHESTAVKSKQLEMKGRELILSSSSAVVTDGHRLTLLAPATSLSEATKGVNSEALDALDFSDVAQLASNINTGIQHGQTLLTLELKYKKAGQWVTEDLSHSLESVSSCSGNIHFNYKNDIDGSIPQSMDEVTLVLTSWISPSENGNRNTVKGPIPMHTACCDCSGWCAFLWTLFAYCNTCLEPQGAEYCCKNCNMPPAPGESCH